MQNGKIFVSDLSSSQHHFHNYHFCRGNSNKRKTRVGIILRGRGTYLYFNKKLNVVEGDTVFIPENIYCYSEWHGDPDIDVLYVSCFMHYEGFQYEPQVIPCPDTAKEQLRQINCFLTSEHSDNMAELEAYSLFYKVLQSILPAMTPSRIACSKTLQTAIAYITQNWDQAFSVCDVAKTCCVSESTLYHLFQKELGQSPVNFLNSVKINIAIEYLENTNYSISTISQLVGFHSENHFRKVFFDFTGTTPLKFRKRI